MNSAKWIHLVYLDRDFNFVRVNDAYAITCGYKPEEMIGKNVDELLIANDHLENLDFIEKCHRDEASRFERRLKCKNGKEVWTIISVKSYKDEHGEFLGAFAMLTDITERKKAERDG